MNQLTVWSDGLWKNNPGLVQLLGLCPLLAVTTSVTNALGLAAATLLVLVMTNLLVSVFRTQIHPDVRIPIFVLIIASSVTLVELLMQAHFFDLSQKLGIFIPLIVTNCTILARAEAFASRQHPWLALQDALAQGLGFGAVLIVMGALRELLGRGTLLAGADQLLGSWAGQLTIQVLPENSGFLLVLLPPGAFFILGLLVALRQKLQARRIRQTSLEGAH